MSQASAVSDTMAAPDAMATYVRQLADGMNLRDWTFILSPVAASPKRHAEVLPVHARMIAEVRVCENFAQLAAATQRHALVHELSHCHLEPAIAPLRADLCRSALKIYEYNIELVTDSLADLLVPHLPLPTVVVQRQ